MNISEEAVEAAWGAFRRSEENMYAALEAATPYLMAEAWYEGRWAGIIDGADSANPYRSGASE